MQLNWQPLALLRRQFESNLEALRSRDEALSRRVEAIAPSQGYFIAGGDQQILLGRATGDGAVASLPNPVSPGASRQIAMKLFPAGQCAEPVLVAGLDQGWLWSALYQMPVHAPRTPGHRPPLYFLANDIERLGIVMHVHDWRAMLHDPRVRLFVGADCVDQARASMSACPTIPWPRLSVTVDPAIWSDSAGIDSILTGANESANARMNQLLRQLNVLDAAFDAPSLAQRFKHGRLRVLGITSLFTTFLQYSMRDWLAAFEELGHETRLLIEQADHEIANPLLFAQVCAEFRPDLILMIDHYRGEFTGLPQGVPCVMWVQDRLPNIFRAQAGAAQRATDYVIGYGRQECVVAHGYPRQRFMPAMVGVNEKRFERRELSADEVGRFTCDVSFVSHASTPAEALVQREIDKSALPQAKRFLATTFEQLRAVYDAGGFVTEAGHIKRMIRESMRACGVETSDMSSVLDFFVQGVNNALFRQQAIAWLAETDVNLHLWGRGWDQHPRFRKHARGVADNEHQLSAIYQASKINLQVTPFGAVHQRLFDGLSAGAFFLLRHCTGDECDVIYRDMWQWCEQAQVRSGAQFFTQAPPHVRDMIDRIVQLTGEDPSRIADTFFLGLEEMAWAGFTRSPATLWADEYPRVAFRTRDELHQLVRHFLCAAGERDAIGASMRSIMLEHMTYTGITRRMLNFIADDLRRQAAPTVLAA
jgi:hypothetical protein